MVIITLQKLFVITFCYYQSVPSKVNGAEFASLLQKFFIPRLEDELVNSTYSYNYESGADENDEFDLDDGRAVECNHSLNANCSLDGIAKHDDVHVNGSDALDDNDVNMTKGGNVKLRRVKRQFSNVMADTSQGMFSKMTAIPYRTLQRCFEFWFMNLFKKDRISLDMPTHPFHLRSARKMGYFTSKLVNATYKRLDAEDNA